MFKMINIFFLQLCLQMFSLNSFAFDIGQLMNKIQSTSVNTVDEAVALIPPNIRSHFTYLYQPHGLRMASFTEPEAILFDTDGTFFVNIGSPNKTMGNTIEILQYDKTSKTAELYALEFPLKRNKNGQFFKPKKNPAQCLQCHGQNPKVLWGSYNEWFGTYHSLEDKGSLNVLDNKGGLSGNEFLGLRDFLNSNRWKSPYKHLGPLEIDIPHVSENAYPYVDSKAELNYCYSVVATFCFALRPNTQLGFLATRINSAILRKELFSNPKFDKNKIFRNYTCQSHASNGTTFDTIQQFLGQQPPQIYSVYDGYHSSYDFFGYSLDMEYNQFLGHKDCDSPKGFFLEKLIRFPEDIDRKAVMELDELYRSGVGL